DIGNPVGMRKVPLSNEELRNYAKKQSPFNNMTITYRKSHILEVGGYQHHLWMEDYNLFLRVIAKGYKIENLPDILVYARIDNGMHG
ncbi:amylovoran biosynthesis protein AmsE, partial [Streptococcus suis]